MSSALTPHAGVTPINTHSLEALLAGLERYGKPMLSRGNLGWWCKVDVTVNVTGAKFEIGSEWHLLPIAAALECAERLRDALKPFGVSV